MLDTGSSRASCTIQILSTNTSDLNGKAYAPEVGDDYYVEVNFKVTGTPASTYRIKFTEANVFGYLTGVPAAAGIYSYWWGETMPLDSAIPVTIQIDPDNVTGAPESGRTAQFSFTPVPPSIPIEYYDAQTFAGQQTVSIQWANNGGEFDGLTWIGEPTSDSYQQVLDQTVPTGSQVVQTEPTGDPILQTIHQNYKPVAGYDTWVTTNAYDLALSSVRVSPILLRQVSWASLSTLPSSFATWLQPTILVQSTAPAIRQFVASILPAGYESSVTPYDAARMLDLAIIARTTYTLSPNTDGSALETLENKQANSQGYSTLFNACLQCIDIPSRTISGYISGTNEYHILNEFYLPGCGWVPADLSFATQWDSTGKYSYFFGSDPQLGNFCTVTRSTFDQVSSNEAGILLSGEYFYSYTGSIVPVATSVGTTSTLSTVGMPASFGLYGTATLGNVTAGSNADGEITVNPINGFGGAVTLTAGGLPAGVTITFQPSVTDENAAFTVSVAKSVKPGIQNVTVVGTSGKLKETVNLPINVLAPPAPPTITFFAPQSVLVGASTIKLTITGTNLTGSTSASWNGHLLTSFVVTNATTATGSISNLYFGTPVSADIIVSSPNGTATSSVPFVVYGKPVITKFTPTSGPIGTKITITGTNLNGATAVTFLGGTAGEKAIPTVNSSTSATVTVPKNSKSGAFTLSTPGGTAVSPGSFSVT